MSGTQDGSRRLSALAAIGTVQKEKWSRNAREKKRFWDDAVEDRGLDLDEKLLRLPPGTQKW